MKVMDITLNCMIHQTITIIVKHVKQLKDFM